jgi:hypothetical protein
MFLAFSFSLGRKGWDPTLWVIRQYPNPKKIPSALSMLNVGSNALLYLATTINAGMIWNDGCNGNN